MFSPRSIRLPLAVLVFLAPLAHAGSIRRIDSDETLRGSVRFEKGELVIAPYKAPRETVRIDLAKVLHVVIADEPAQAQALPKPTGDDRLPNPLELTEIGQLNRPSSATYKDNGRFSIKSAGARLGGERDSFCFVQQKLEGDAELAAQVQLRDPSKAQAGLMIRASTEPDAPFAAIMMGHNKVQWLRRTAPGKKVESSDISVPGGSSGTLWLQITRHAGTLTALTSRDGRNWAPVPSEVFNNLPRALHYGLAVCGRDELAGGYFESVRFATAAPLLDVTTSAGLREGVMLRTGTLLAGAPIHQADENTIKFSKWDRPSVSVSIKMVARMIFVDLSPAAAAKIPAGRSGVLLREGDFIEGEFRGVRGGRFQLSSVLFGLKTFERGSQAQAIVISDVSPQRPAAIVRATDGSVIMAKSVSIDKDRLVVEDELAGTFLLSRDQVASIVAGPGRLVLLDTLKPSAIEGRAGVPEPFAVVTANPSAPLMLGSQPVERGMMIRSGCSASWKLDGQYRTLIYRAGVPAGVLPTAGMRFILVADGKETSLPLRTSLDEPQAETFALSGVNTLTLKVESTAGPALPLPGIWAEVSLVK